MRFPDGFSALSHRDFRVFWSGQLVSQLGTWMQRVGQASILTVLVWTGVVRYWHVAVLATVYGLANAFDMPTRQSFIADLVGKRDLMNAVALNSAMFNSARLVGPAVAGLLIARLGLAQTFAFNAVSFLAVIIALGLLRTDGDPQPSAGTTLLEQIAGG